MRSTTRRAELDRLQFAEAAALDFKKFPDHATYGTVAPGEYLALRWGMGGDCVLVVTLDANEEPVNFQGLVKLVKEKS